MDWVQDFHTDDSDWLLVKFVVAVVVVAGVPPSSNASLPMLLLLLLLLLLRIAVEGSRLEAMVSSALVDDRLLRSRGGAPRSSWRDVQLLVGQQERIVVIHLLLVVVLLVVVVVMSQALLQEVPSRRRGQ